MIKSSFKELKFKLIDNFKDLDQEILFDEDFYIEIKIKGEKELSLETKEKFRLFCIKNNLPDFSLHKLNPKVYDKDYTIGLSLVHDDFDPSLIKGSIVYIKKHLNGNFYE